MADWIKGAIKKPGSFTAQAKSRGMSPAEFQSKVLANPGNYNSTTVRRANLRKTLVGMEQGGEMPEYSLGGNVTGQQPSAVQQGIGSFGLWGAAISAISSIGTKAGDAIGGDVGGAISGMFDPAAALQNKDWSTGKKLLGAAVPMLGGIWASRDRKKQADEAENLQKYQQSISRGNARLMTEDPQQQYMPLMPNGGEVTGTADADWQTNWYNKRKDILQSNLMQNPATIYTGADPNAMVYKVKSNFNTLTDYGSDRYSWIAASNEDKAQWSSPNVKGAYSPESHSLFYTNPVTKQHEKAHGSGIQGVISPAIMDKVSKYQGQSDSFFGTIKDKNKAENYKQYLTDPREIHSRLMELRYKYNLDPEKKVTPEDVKRIREEEFLESPDKQNWLLKMYEDDAAIDFLNNIVSNAKPNTNMMQRGGIVGEPWIPVKTTDPYNGVVATRKVPKAEMAEREAKEARFRQMVAAENAKGNVYTDSRSQVSQAILSGTEDAYYKRSAKGKFAMGGLAQPNVELEGGESFATPQGDNLNVNGPSHANGGVPLNLPTATKVFSDRLKMPGTKKTFSDVNKPLAKEINKYQDIMDDQRATRLAKNTASKMLSKAEAKQEELFAMQQSMNGNSTGEQPMGLPKGAFGLEMIASVAGQNAAAAYKPTTPEMPKLSNSFIGNMAQLAPMAYNLGQGLFGKTEQYNAEDFQNPYASSALGMMKNRTVNVDPMMEANRRANSIANRNVATAARTRGEMLSAYGANAAGRAAADTNVIANAQNMQNQYVGETASMAANLGQQRAATSYNVAQQNAANRASKRNYTATGLGQLSNYAQVQQQMKGQQYADQLRINALKGIVPHYDPITGAYLGK